MSKFDEMSPRGKAMIVFITLLYLFGTGIAVGIFYAANSDSMKSKICIEPPGKKLTRFSSATLQDISMETTDKEYAKGYQDGYTPGYYDGYNTGYNAGTDTTPVYFPLQSSMNGTKGYPAGYDRGVEVGRYAGYNDGIEARESNLPYGKTVKMWKPFSYSYSKGGD